MNALDVLTGPFAQAVGWALLHLLWQASIVAGLLAAVLALLPRRSANARYAIACSALAIVFAMFVITVIRSWDPAAPPVSTAAAGQQLTDDAVPLVKVPVVIAATAAAGWRDRALDFMATARQSLPSLVALWMAGVLVLATRLLVSWGRARALATHATTAASEEWQRTAARLSEALGLRRAVRLLESAAVEVPSVLGTLRPVILLPASTLTGLTPEQIEMVLAHELAHIRRHDFLVNLLQAFVETLMFYHPAVWWMSHTVRVERENCCDDLAVAVCGNPIQYARALTRLEELRTAALPIVVAANGGSLLDRIRRIAAYSAEGAATGPRWVAAIAVLAVVATAVAVPSLPAFGRNEPPKPVAPPVPATARIDVVQARPPLPPVPARPGQPAPLDIDVDVDVPDVPDLPDLDHDFDFDFDFDYEESVREAIEPGVRGALAGMPVPAPFAVAFASAHRFDDAHDEAADEDEEETPDRRLSDGGKLTIDELISLRAVGVTPEYMDAMRALFPDLTVREVTGLRAVGVTAEFVRDMSAAGVPVTSAHAATSLRAVGVTPEYVRSLRAAGVKLESARDASSLRALGVTVEFVTKLAEAGYRNLSVRELSRLAASGVDGDFIREMERYRDKGSSKKD
jgi:beta-lactamase regulating signal transducer with metallopeptidase domain